MMKLKKIDILYNLFKFCIRKKEGKNEWKIKT